MLPVWAQNCGTVERLKEERKEYGGWWGKDKKDEEMDVWRWKTEEKNKEIDVWWWEEDVMDMRKEEDEEEPYRVKEGGGGTEERVV